MRWVFLDGCHVSGPKGVASVPSGGLCTLSAVLVLNQGHPVPRDRIEDILWEGSRPENARDRVNTMLWRLRKLVVKVGGPKDVFRNLRDYLQYDDPAADESDLAEIGRLARSVMRDGISTAPEAETCMACVQGCHTEFLPHASDHWSMITRESLRSGLLMIIEALIIYMRAHSRWGRVTELAQRMLALDPTLEIGHRQLIDMHGERDDKRAAMRQYAVMQKVLKTTLGVDPEPETAAAIDALKIGRGRDAPEAGPVAPGARSQALIRRPSLRSVQIALDHIDAARDRLMR